MAVEKGLVTYFDGEYGEIKKSNEKYIFLKQDIMSTIDLGDYVSFKGEEVQGVKRAYFINTLENDKIPQLDKNKQKELI